MHPVATFFAAAMQNEAAYGVHYTAITTSVRNMMNQALIIKYEHITSILDKPLPPNPPPNNNMQSYHLLCVGFMFWSTYLIVDR